MMQIKKIKNIFKPAKVLNTEIKKEFQVFFKIIIVLFLKKIMKIPANLKLIISIP